MDTRAVINLHFGGARQISIPGLQAKVAAALRHAGKDKEALSILLRDPLVLDNGFIKSHLELNDITGYHPPFVSFDEAKTLQGQDGILFAESSISFSRMSDEAIEELADFWLNGLWHAWHEYLDLNPGAKPDWMDDNDLEADIRLKTGYAKEQGPLSLWMVQEYIENHTPFFTTYVGDQWADMVIISPKFFDDWANRVLGSDDDDWMVV
jgi:hypothetical protein